MVINVVLILQYIIRFFLGGLVSSVERVVGQFHITSWHQREHGIDVIVFELVNWGILSPSEVGLNYFRIGVYSGKEFLDYVKVYFAFQCWEF